MCKSALIAGVAAALSLAGIVAAQTARLDVQVSTDNVSWSDSLFAPAGSTVFVRVVASTTAPNAVGLARVTYQPTLTGWTSGDTRMFFTSSTGASAYDNAGLPANLGRMTPYGAAPMNQTSTPGLLVSFNDAGGVLRFAGSRATSMTTNLDYGVVSNQNSKVTYPTYNPSNSAVIFKYGIQLGASTALREMVADVPLASVKGGKISWYGSLITSTGNPFDTPITQADIDPATIRVGPPNSPPVAVNDSFNMLEDQSLVVTAASVLNNDSDPDANETLSVELVAGAGHGQLTFNADGTFAYIPGHDFNGLESFTYLVRDRYSAASNIATVTINVADVNDQPIFTAADPAATMEDAGARTIANWATFNPGNGETQSVAEYQVMGVDNTGLFAPGGLPAVSNDGTLRFTPATNTSGSASFELRVHDDGGTDNGGVDMSPSGTFTIVVLPVNDPPILTGSPIAPVAEDAGQQSLAHWASFEPGPGEGDQALLGFAVSAISNPSLFSLAPTIAPDGTLVFTPALNAFGASTFTVTARDSGGSANGGADTSAPQVFSISITPVNDAPTATLSPIPAALEDSGAKTVLNFASFNPGPGEASQSLTGYTIMGISDPSMFAVLPAVSAAGTLTYTPAPNASGTVLFAVQAHDNGGVAGGGADVSAPVLASINITPVNDAPSLSAANPAPANEDAGPQTITGWATFGGGGGADEGGQAPLAYTVSNVSNTALFAAQPAVGIDGSLTYTPAANASGTSSFSVRVRDNGGVANGGADTSATQAFTITVNAVNDAPSVTLRAIPTIVEDAGPQTVSAFASFSPGPGESGQTLLGYTVADVSNPAMFAAGPSISAAGALTYTPAPNASGSVTFTVTARDSGGAANGGADTSAPVAASLTITNVNDAPTFAAANPTGNEDAGPVSIAGWASFNPGPFESGQAAAYQVSSITNPSLFAPGGTPAVAPDGTLSFATAPDLSGTATFTVRVRDDGGIAGGGVDTSAPQTFTLTVNGVNDAPTVTLGPIPVINEDGPAQTVPGFASFSPGGGAGESGQALLEYLVSEVSNPAAFAVMPAVNAAGALTYTPAPDASGTITFTVRARDNGGTMYGGVELSAPASAALTINGVNDPPVAFARDVVIDARTGCTSLVVTPAEVDNGSRDPDNAPSELTLRLNRSGEFPVGSTAVVLSVTDPAGLTSTAQAHVIVLATDADRNTVPDSCDLIRGGGGPDCDGDGDSDESQCVWDNGGASPTQSTVNGQLSQYGGSIASRVADDFYLQPGLLYRITGFRGQILTNSIERTARLSFFLDCDGKPTGEPFAVFESSEVSSETPGDNGKVLVTYVFNLCEDKLVLEGGQQYWISLQGKVNCNQTDLAYWAIVGAEGNPSRMIGSVPYKALGMGDHPCTVTSYDDWETIADCCIGCANMAYSMTGSACQIIWDNGDVDRGPTRGGDPSGINRGTFARAADNIVVKPCRTETICWIEAYIWTNCTPVFGFLEVYDNSCNLPTGGVRHRAVPTDIIELDDRVVIDGDEYRLVKLEFWDVPWTLVGGKNYWISVGADGAGSFNARSFFAYSVPVSPCGCREVHLSKGAKLPNRQSDTRWIRADREYAFRIATKPFFMDGVPSPAELCPQDTNRNGSVTVDDLLLFLQNWFIGCP